MQYFALKNLESPKPPNHGAFVKKSVLPRFEYLRAASTFPWSAGWNAQIFVARKSRQPAYGRPLKEGMERVGGF